MVIYFKPIFILHNYLFYININTNGAFSMAQCFHFYISGHYNLFCSGLIIYQFSFSAHEPFNWPCEGNWWNCHILFIRKKTRPDTSQFHPNVMTDFEILVHSAN